MSLLVRVFNMLLGVIFRPARRNGRSTSTQRSVEHGAMLRYMRRVVAALGFPEVLLAVQLDGPRCGAFPAQ